MNETWPASSVAGDPDTGASRRWAPRVSISAASARTASGLTVLISTCTASRRSPARMPSDPRQTASRAGASVTIVETISAAGPASSRAVGDGDRADLELAPRVRRQPRDLDGRRGRQMAAEVPRPHTVQVILLADIGEIARSRDEIVERAARRLERLLEVLHRAHRLRLHRGRQVELLVAMRVAVVDGGGRHA